MNTELRKKVEKRLHHLFGHANHEFVESGYDSVFRRDFTEILNQQEEIVVSIVETFLDSFEDGDRRFNYHNGLVHSLKVLADFDERPISYEGKMQIFLKALVSKDVELRDQGAIQLHNLEDPSVIRAIEYAIETEENTDPYLIRVLSDLRLVANGKPVSNDPIIL